MTAYELADEIEQAIEEKEFMTSASEKWHKEIANMLRQQADEIKELHKIAQVMAMQESNARKSLQNKIDRIAELEKELAILEGEYPEPTINAKIKEFNDLQEAYEAGKRDALK